MALNFPDAPTNGQKYTDATTSETWTYEAATNSWTSDGLTTAVGVQYKGGIDVTTAPPAGVKGGWQYTVTTGGAVNAGFTGLTGNIPTGTTIIFDGTNWQQAGTGVLWVRTGTALAPANAGDAVTVSAGTAALPGLTLAGDPNTGIYSPGADQLAISTGGSGRLFVDSSGRVLAGTPTARPSANGLSAGLQVEGVGTAGSLSVIRNGGLAYLTIGRSGSGAIGSNVAIANNDELGRISWAAADGTDIQSWAAQISGEIDGVPGADDVPGRLVFSTTSDGQSAPTERMRIDSTGLMTLAGPGIKFPAAAIASADPNTLDDYEEGTWTPTQGRGLTVVGAFSSSGTYIKIGKVVHLSGQVSGATSVAAAANNQIVGLAPYPVKGGINGAAPGLAVSQSGEGSVIQFSNTSFYARTAIAASPAIYFSATYEVN
jgi:hypothetical protein